jgi:ABC-2 type transport system permease protein
MDSSISLTESWLWRHCVIGCGHQEYANTPERVRKMVTIKKYLRIFGAFFRASFIADIEFRFNFILRIFTDLLWYASHILLFEVLYLQTSTINGWTLPETRVFLGVLFVVDAMWMILFSENLDQFSEKVRKGDLDLNLVKPINSQFMLSFKKISTAFFFNFTVANAFLIYALLHVETTITPSRLILLALIIPASLIIVYSLRFLFACITIIFTNTDNITFLWYQIYKLGTRPDSIYPPIIRYVILSLMPVGFVASVPASLVLGKANPWLALAALFIGALNLYLTHRFWNYSLKHYTSASS